MVVMATVVVVDAAATAVAAVACATVRRKGGRPSILTRWLLGGLRRQATPSRWCPLLQLLPLLLLLLLLLLDSTQCPTSSRRPMRMRRSSW